MPKYDQDKSTRSRATDDLKSAKKEGANSPAPVLLKRTQSVTTLSHHVSLHDKKEIIAKFFPSELRYTKDIDVTEKDGNNVVRFLTNNDAIKFTVRLSKVGIETEVVKTTKEHIKKDTKERTVECTVSIPDDAFWAMRQSFLKQDDKPNNSKNLFK